MFLLLPKLVPTFSTYRVILAVTFQTQQWLCCRCYITSAHLPYNMATATDPAVVGIPLHVIRCRLYYFR